MKVAGGVAVEAGLGTAMKAAAAARAREEFNLMSRSKNPIQCCEDARKCQTQIAARPGAGASRYRHPDQRRAEDSTPLLSEVYSDLPQINRLKTDLKGRRVAPQPEIILLRRNEQRVRNNGIPVMAALAPFFPGARSQAQTLGRGVRTRHQRGRADRARGGVDERRLEGRSVL